MDNSVAVREMYGMQFSLLAWLDGSWLESQLPNLFPEKPGILALREFELYWPSLRRRAGTAESRNPPTPARVSAHKVCTGAFPFLTQSPEKPQSLPPSRATARAGRFSEQLQLRVLHISFFQDGNVELAHCMRPTAAQQVPGGGAGAHGIKLEVGREVEQQGIVFLVCADEHSGGTALVNKV